MPRIPLLCCLLLLTVTLARAQEATPAAAVGWTMEQRCVGEPSTPPDDWSFEGTLFLRGEDFNVRGYRSDMDTTYIIAFHGADFTLSGALSPDGHWFAVPHGSTSPSTAYPIDTYFIIDRIRIYDTSPARETHEIEWDNRRSVGSEGSLEDVVWLDNSHFMYAYGGGSYTDGEAYISDIDGTTYPTSFSTLAQFSPDSSRVIDYTFHDGANDWALFSGETGQVINDLPNRGGALWLPDSSGFFRYGQSNMNRENLELYSRDGNVLDTVAVQPFSFLGISRDGHYLALARRDTTQNASTLFIADLEQYNITDTCLQIDIGFPTGQFTWASDSTIVYTYLAERVRQIAVLNLQTQTNYILENVDGTILGWRRRLTCLFSWRSTLYSTQRLGGSNVFSGTSIYYIPHLRFN
ncbi:MAG: hypothetical protein U0694_05855 [Anaerolineae bacterium]